VLPLDWRYAGSAPASLDRFLNEANYRSPATI
jgi:hypothetical protein